ncbi:chromatin assembly factor 1 subunit A-like [Physella acuta]|uniref:chromatin assembly factor 1 subunit A-like n=1 Tax=Physella acuta TaxID=109671 RepID=UPI0027DBC526|nr:chromatin assembly factor 1 subunit A-like [Physella acuta]
MEKLAENQPPTKKLKQAILPFFKTAMVAKDPVKINPIGQGKKRRNSNSLESPTKSGKTIIKPLAALGNAESPNSKASKIRKISFGDDNGNEVSSSSEAEAAVGKAANGKCCLLDRFVKILPPDTHQEISSTNEGLEMSVEVEAPSENQNDSSEEKSSNAALDSSILQDDCIIIDDDSANTVISDKKVSIECSETQEASPSEDLVKKPTSIVNKKGKSPVQKSQGAKKSPGSAGKSKGGKKCAIKEVSQSVVPTDKENPNQNDTVEAEDDNLDQSVNNSFSSEICSTPFKDCDQSLSETEGTPGSSILKTPKTPMSSAKRRKIDSTKKAEKEKIKAEREKERLEKKRKLEEEKAEKERIRLEKKEAKEREKQELKEKLEKEKQEKEKAKEEERKRKEDERLKKEEDKKKRQAALDAKNEEKKKKEEERKQKEEEKIREEEEKRKKEEKTKQVFQKFFIKPKDTPSKQVSPKPAPGFFIPFEVKKDMHLAPAVRGDALTEEKKTNLDQIINSTESCVKTYLQQLKCKEIIPKRTGRILRKNPQPAEDVEIIHDSEALKKALHQVKLLQFHTDYRPPYYGTWRKQPKLNPRNPWKKDESLFDYEVDSDDEWEEEEPGESLSCSDGEEEKGEDVDEDEDDGWMVPHGYLSEDEGCNEDDEITPEKLKLQQLAKAKAWEDEQKRKLQVAPLITVGCFFQHWPSASMSGDVRLLYEFKAVVLAASTPIPTSLSGSIEPEKEETATEGVTTTPLAKGFKTKAVPDEAMPYLIRLVHGNVSGIKRLIREFRVFWLKQTNESLSQSDAPAQNEKVDESVQDCDTSILNESVNEVCNPGDGEEKGSSKSGEDDKKLDEGYGCSISKRQLDLKITKMAVREKREGFKRICWYVHDHILSQFNMSDIKLPNSWVYVSSSAPKAATPNINKSVIKNETETTEAEKLEETPIKATPKDQRSIMDFTLTKEELLKNQPSKPAEITPAKANLVSQETPKENKKPNSQRSIMEFAKKANSSHNKGKSLPNKANDLTNLNVSTIEVINVDSNSSSDVICIDQYAKDSSTAHNSLDTPTLSSSTINSTEQMEVDQQPL